MMFSWLFKITQLITCSEVWHWPGLSSSHRLSQILMHAISEETWGKGSHLNRGVKKHTFGVLQAAREDNPIVLTEGFFLSERELQERSDLVRSYSKKIGIRIAKGLTQWFKVQNSRSLSLSLSHFDEEVDLWKLDQPSERMKDY